MAKSTLTVSRLTQKYQATIPARVRAALGLKAGDAIAFEIGAGEIRIRKAQPIDWEFAKGVEGTLTEWNSQADEDAYRDL